VKRTLLALASGALLGAPFIVPQLWPLALVGLAPLLIALSRPLGMWRAFSLGILAGTVFYGIAIWAIFWTALPLNWLGVFDPTFQIVLVSLCWGMTVLGFALWTGVFALVFSKLAMNSWKDIVTASALWVICEWAGAWWFGIENAGTGTVPGPHATLSFLGNMLANDTVLVQGAWLGGVYALSFLCALGGAILYRAVRGGTGERRLIALAVFLAVIIWTSGHVLLARTSSWGSGERIRIAAVSTQEPAVFVPTAEQEAANLGRMVDALAQTRGSAVVVMPEGSDLLRLLNKSSPGNAKAVLSTIFAGTEMPAVIDSGSAYAADGTQHSRMDVYDIGTDSYETEDKHFLLPYGEYAPLYVRAFVTAVGEGNSLGTLLSERGLSPGDDTRPLTVASTTMGVLFCNEAMSPVLYASLAREGATVFINAASHAWFHDSRLVAGQMRDVSIIRAVESRRWYVQASGVSPSFILDPYGRVIAASSWGEEGVIAADVEERTDTTPYLRFGPWVLWVAGLALLITYARSRRNMQ